eukprot:1383843-Rhodomonas_salina.1
MTTTHNPQAELSNTQHSPHAHHPHRQGRRTHAPAPTTQMRKHARCARSGGQQWRPSRPWPAPPSSAPAIPSLSTASQYHPRAQYRPRHSTFRALSTAPQYHPLAQYRVTVPSPRSVPRHSTIPSLSTASQYHPRAQYRVTVRSLSTAGA